MNQLAAEKSPYLLQHAGNPVNWYPWGKEAFAKAKEEDKPIFLSIGYSTCHWCHVMAYESFEDEEVANLLNQHFVSIKVDREERPDVDAVYMAACQALTGSGGWPLTIIMTPEQKPFFAGTYFPKHGRYGVTGLMELLEAVGQQWRQNRQGLLRAGEELTGFLQRQQREEPEETQPRWELAEQAAALFQKGFHPVYGGFGKAPKFPTPHNLLFLLRFAAWDQKQGPLAEQALFMAEKTLEQMYRGGLFDHIGGGFSRYSTDEQWLAPHFEKMLYDNALLAMAYTEAYHLTKRPLYKEVALRTLNYICRELFLKGGGFACGQDADSQGEEGKYYLFTQKEVLSVLGSEQGEAFCSRFGITPQGNFEGKNIINLLSCPNFVQEPPEFGEMRQRLYVYRLARTPLHRDDKALTSWNSLAIAALARAAWVLEQPEYLNIAQVGHRFISENLKDEAGRLLARWREGQAAYQGTLEDYAFYALALMELYTAQGRAEDLLEAEEVANTMVALFEDKDNGGFYLYSRDAEQLISRPKETYDGALPSGNSAAALVFSRLSRATGKTAWQEKAQRQLAFVCGAAAAYPPGSSFGLLALLETLSPSWELVLCTQNEEDWQQLQNILWAVGPKNGFVLVKTSQNQERLAKIAPFTQPYPIPTGEGQCYLCKNGTCMQPQTLSQLANLLQC